MVNLLEQHFTRLVDYDFTAAVEEDLDSIAGGGMQSVDWLTRFYFGSENGEEGGIARAGGLKRIVSERLGDIDARGINSIPLHRHRGASWSGSAATGRTWSGADGARRQRARGPAAGRADQREGRRAASTPRPASGCSAPTRPPARRSRSRPAGTGRTCPPGERDGRSLFASMSIDTVTLDEALRLLTLPRVLGIGADGEEITAQNGRYGPYIKQGKESRSLETRGPAVHGHAGRGAGAAAQPKTRGRRSATRPPRCVSSATTRRPASRSWSGRAGSGRT